MSSGIITAIKYASRDWSESIPKEEIENVRNTLKRLAKKLIDAGILPEDYEVPWEREEKGLFEYLILKTAELQEKIRRLDSVEASLRELEKSTWVERAKVGKAVISSGEEAVKKCSSEAAEYSRDSSFYTLLKTLRQIKSREGD